jgi:MFS family permease
MNTEQCASSANVCKRVCGIRCISWSAIIAGAFVAIGLSFLLNLFSTAIGLSIYKMSPEGVNKLAVGGMLGFAIGIIATMFFAGWVAGYFGRSHCSKKCCGALYGLTTWCVALVLMIILALPFSRFITGYTNYLSNTAVVTTVESTENSTAKKATVTVQGEATLDDLSKGAFVLFLMFFLGALASTVGGHAGVSCCYNKECCNSACKCGKCCK